MLSDALMIPPSLSRQSDSKLQIIKKLSEYFLEHFEFNLAGCTVTYVANCCFNTSCMSILPLFSFFGSALFVQLMDQTETWYLQLPVTGLPERNKVGILGQCELNYKNVT